MTIDRDALLKSPDGGPMVKCESGLLKKRLGLLMLRHAQRSTMRPEKLHEPLVMLSLPLIWQITLWVERFTRCARFMQRVEKLRLNVPGSWNICRIQSGRWLSLL